MNAPRTRFAAAALALALVAAACTDGAAEPAPLGFTDVANEVGLEFTHGAFQWGLSADPAAMMGGGLCWIDYDNDGWLDLFVVNTWAEAEWGLWQEEEGGLPTSALFKNRRGDFADVSEKAGVNLELRGNGCVAGDLDGDGHTDLYVTTARGDVLLWNNGDGTFSDGTAAVADTYGWHSGAAIGDVNGDGLPDLFVTGYADPNTPNPEGGLAFPNTQLALPDLLYLNMGPGPDGHAVFEEVGRQVGLETSGLEYGLGAVLSDFDSDGDLDLFVANDTNPNRLYENISVIETPGFRFSDVTEAAGVGDINSGMGVAAEDYDGDGLSDIIVTNLGDQLHSVYRNKLNLGFTEDHTGLGIPDFGVGSTGWGVSWADYDLDGDRDLMIANGFIPLNGDEDRQPIAFYTKTESGLADTAGVVGISAIGPIHGRGLAAADYDNDGDVDVAVAAIGGPLRLLENTTAGPNWLGVDLDGFNPGAIVTVTLDDGRQLRCEVRAGSSWLSSEDPRCHFGLGSATVQRVLVQWPDGQRAVVEAPDANTMLGIDSPAA
ncbi:MAG: CRTAC1 family protein [Acidimicrobiia bacterium]|nr:CRTAC1 family protein [Acidimicrobiia bacterium]